MWFCAQCIARLSQGLGISLLELSTFGHALVTLFIYCVWWSKPLDIRQPEQIVIRKEQELELFAAMCALSPLHSGKTDVRMWNFLSISFKNASHLAEWRIWSSVSKFARALLELDISNEQQIVEIDRSELLDRQMEPDSPLFFPVLSYGDGDRRWISGLGTGWASPKNRFRYVSPRQGYVRGMSLQTTGKRCTTW